MAVKFDEGTKDTIKWIMGIIAALILMSAKYSFDTSAEATKRLEQKVDKVYEFSTNHEVRIAVIEKQIEEHSKKILDLQLAKERLQIQESRLHDNEK